MKKLFFFILLIILYSCGNEPPNISFPIYNILIFQAGSQNNIPTDSIFLSMYFVINDEDGFDDISNIKITHIKSEYSWILQSDQLTKYDYQDKTYYGYSFLEYDNAKSLLLGDYQVTIEDKSGNKTELLLNIEIENTDQSVNYQIPQINYNIVSFDKGKELKILNDSYSSAEVKILNRPELFNNGRKKFKEDEKIILNNNSIFPENTPISIKINKDINESMIYFLKTYNLKY